MSLATGQTITFYSSSDLKEWKKLSDFGDGIGAHGGVWECPDLIQMDYNGQKKWVLLVSINPGGPNGGSATQYFVGDFDGVTFKADNLPYPLWIDYGKDNYAGVTWNNVPDGRHLFIAWMSNWQYAGVVPSMTWRGGMTLPRELALQKDADGRPIITSRIVKEVDAIAGEWKTISASDNTYAIDNNEDAYELQINMDIADNENLTLTLSNEKGDKYPISLNRADKSFIIDRTQSGEVSFSSEFGKVLYSPLNLSSNAVSLTLFVDKSSVEALINDGMVQQTNLVYPSGIYNSLSVESGKGQIIKSVKVRTLSSVW
jgi:fructan beta-fructosidase